MSLDEIAAGTKIGTRLLRALEDEQFERLPGGIFNKGFVRAYAKYLGIDEEGAVADYLSAAGQSDPDPRIVAAQSFSEYGSKAAVAASVPSRRASFPFIPVVILILVVAAASGAWHIYQDRQHQAAAKQALAQISPPVAPGVPDTPSAGQPRSSQPQPATPNRETPANAKTQTNSGTSGSGREAAESTHSGNARVAAKAVTEAAREPARETASVNTAPAGNLIAAANPSEAPGPPFEISVKAKDRAWVSIKSDGKIMVRGIIKPPDVKTIHANDQVVFWTGNAGDVEVSFNGRDVPLSGGQNQEQVLVFNSRGLQPRGNQ